MEGSQGRGPGGVPGTGGSPVIPKSVQFTNPESGARTDLRRVLVGRSRGVWAVKYPTDRRQYLHDLNIDDYGSVWVVVEKT